MPTGIIRATINHLSTGQVSENTFDFTDMEKNLSSFATYYIIVTHGHYVPEQANLPAHYVF